MLKKCWLITIGSQKRERGSALILALILFAIGALMIVPLLGLMGSGFKTTDRVYDQKANELYAADAGVRYAILKIKENVDFLAPDDPAGVYTVLDSDGNPELINGKQVTYTLDRLPDSEALSLYTAKAAYRIISTACDPSDSTHQTTITSDFIFVEGPSSIFEDLIENLSTYHALAHSHLQATSIATIVPTESFTGYTSTPEVIIAAPDTPGTTAEATAYLATTGVSEIIVTNGGSGYDSAPEVAIAAPPAGGSQAYATATITGAVHEIIMISRGSGYTIPPLVTIVDPSDPEGERAQAIANITSGGSVLAVNVTNGGSGYTNPGVTFMGGNGGVSATGTVTTSLGARDITLSSGGTGYSSPPSVEITGDGIGAAATAVMSGYVSSINVKNGGKNYSSSTRVEITGGSGFGAQAMPVIVGGKITQINVTNPGTGYTLPLTVDIIDTTGTNANATASIAYTVVDVIVTSTGNGYTFFNPVGFSGGSGSGAAATVEPTTTIFSVTVTDGGSGYTSVPTVTFSGCSGNVATADVIMDCIVSSIEVIDGGSGYSDEPTVTIAPPSVGNNTAQAYATISTVVNGFTITDPGSGYDMENPPAVTLIGGGYDTKAEAEAVLLPTSVDHIVVDNGGAGYTTLPEVYITDGVVTDSTPTVTLEGSPVDRIDIEVIQGEEIRGHGYEYAPDVSLEGEEGNGAEAEATISGPVNYIKVTDSGKGYSNNPSDPGYPQVYISGGGTGFGAGAEAVVMFNEVNAINITDPGSNYSECPSVDISAPPGTDPELYQQAYAEASIDGSIDTITVTNPGDGYTSPPRVFFEGGFSGLGEHWPTVEEVTEFYRNQIEDEENPADTVYSSSFPNNTIDFSTINEFTPGFASLYEDGKLFIEGDVKFSTDSKQNDPLVYLPGTIPGEENPEDPICENRLIYVNGSIEFTNDCYLDLNGYTIFSTSDLTQAEDGRYAVKIWSQTKLDGPGGVIGVGDVDFQPHLNNTEYLFVMSLTGKVNMQPNSALAGSLAAPYNINLQPNNIPDWLENLYWDNYPPSEGVGSVISGGIQSWIID